MLPLLAGWLAVAAGLAFLTWRGVRPLLPAFAALPVAAAAPQGEVWRATGADDRLLVNVAEAVRAGRAQVRSPSGATAGPDRFVDVRHLAVTDATGNRGWAGTSRRQWLYLHPPSDVSVDVAIPPSAEVWFQAALAMDPAMWSASTGDGAHFQVLLARINAASRPEPPVVLIDRKLNPRARGEDQRWVPVEADLTRWAGNTVRLTLQTLSLDDLTNDWAGWGNPVVVTRDSARQRPRFEG
jgi:hypothetical protein